MSTDPNRVVEVGKDAHGGKYVMFFCPGCQMYHSMRVERGPGRDHDLRWDWNEDVVKPTLSPSLGINMGTDMQCHLFVRDGKLEFLGDSRHHLSGQTVPMLLEDTHV